MYSRTGLAAGSFPLKPQKIKGIPRTYVREMSGEKEALRGSDGPESTAAFFSGIESVFSWTLPRFVDRRSYGAGI
jgi:hypothetical protein